MYHVKPNFRVNKPEENWFHNLKSLLLPMTAYILPMMVISHYMSTSIEKRTKPKYENPYLLFNRSVPPALRPFAEPFFFFFQIAYFARTNKQNLGFHKGWLVPIAILGFFTNFLPKLAWALAFPITYPIFALRNLLSDLFSPYTKRKFSPTQTKIALALTALCLGLIVLGLCTIFPPAGILGALAALPHFIIHLPMMIAGMSSLLTQIGAGIATFCATVLAGSVISNLVGRYILRPLKSLFCGKCCGNGDIEMKTLYGSAGYSFKNIGAKPEQFNGRDSKYISETIKLNNDSPKDDDTNKPVNNFTLTDHSLHQHNMDNGDNNDTDNKMPDEATLISTFFTGTLTDSSNIENGNDGETTGCFGKWW